MRQNPKLTFKGPAYGGPLAGVDIEHEHERKDVYVLDHIVGHYVFFEDQWLWSPLDANEAAA